MKKYTIGLITGALLAVSAMMFIGATNQNKNLGDITVNSIGVVNNDGKPVAVLTASENGGMLGISNNDGKPVAGINADEDGGNFWIYNKHNKQVVALQSNKNLDGAIGLYDRYGDLGWGETGKQ